MACAFSFLERLILAVRWAHPSLRRAHPSLRHHGPLTRSGLVAWPMINSALWTRQIAALWQVSSVLCLWCRRLFITRLTEPRGHARAPHQLPVCSWRAR